MAANQGGDAAAYQSLDSVVSTTASSAQGTNDALAPYRADEERYQLARREYQLRGIYKNADEATKPNALNFSQYAITTLPQLTPYAALAFVPGMSVVRSVAILGGGLGAFNGFINEDRLRWSNEQIKAYKSAFDIPQAFLAKTESECENVTSIKSALWRTALDGSAVAYAGYRFGGIYGAVAGGLLGVAEGLWTSHRFGQEAKQHCVAASIFSELRSNLSIHPK